MKSIFIILAVAFTILIFSGCKKDKLPPLKCNSLQFNFWPTGQGPLIDSIQVSLVQSDVTNGNKLDTTIYNPGWTSTKFDFCGVFKYKIKVYSAPGIKMMLDLRVTTKSIYSEELKDNETVEGEFVYDFPL